MTEGIVWKEGLYRHCHSTGQGGIGLLYHLKQQKTRSCTDGINRAVTSILNK